MTLKQTLFELGLLISHAFLFQVYNATDSLKATRAIYSFLGLNIYTLVIILYLYIVEKMYRVIGVTFNSER